MVMDEKKIRPVILQKLYDLYINSRGNTGMTIPDIANELGFDIKTVEESVRGLKANKYIDNRTMTQIRITSEGVKEIERVPKSNPGDTHFHQTIEFNGDNAGQINQAHTINNPSLFLRELADAIENLPDLEPEKKSRWKATLLEISKHPGMIAIMTRLLSLFG